MSPSSLNYHHLLYFWAVAKEGGLRLASEVLHVSQPSISAQLKQLEESLGAPLFTRTTRRLMLTDTGQTVLQYAEEIFSLGSELLAAVRQGPPFSFSSSSWVIFPGKALSAMARASAKVTLASFASSSPV
jgi:DNA-binding transcriptional LysR family regulator